MSTVESPVSVTSRTLRTCRVAVNVLSHGRPPVLCTMTDLATIVAGRIPCPLSVLPSSFATTGLSSVSFLSTIVGPGGRLSLLSSLALTFLPSVL